jgi:hypothetical protein
MTKPEGSPNDEIRMTGQSFRRGEAVAFELRASKFFRHSSFVIRHSANIIPHSGFFIAS